MGNIGRGRALGAVALVVLLGAVVLAFVAGYRPAQRADAAFPQPGLDFSISVGTQCDSTAGPADCSFSRGETFTLDLNLNTIPEGFRWEGYNVGMDFSGVAVNPSSLVKQGPDLWPDCSFPALDFSIPGQFYGACSSGAASLPTTYTGPLLHLDFQCANADVLATIRLLHGEAYTELLSELTTVHSGETGSEALTIRCGTPPTPTPTNTPTPGGATATPTATPTPGGATATPTSTPTNTPTITPTPTFTVTPTRTRRPHETLRGDVDGDLTVDARDALWVLWFNAGIVVDVPIPEAADMNEDDVVDATDALFILWVDAGTYQPL